MKLYYNFSYSAWQHKGPQTTKYITDVFKTENSKLHYWNHSIFLHHWEFFQIVIGETFLDQSDSSFIQRCYSDHAPVRNVWLI